jgi:hypothetical protein
VKSLAVVPEPPSRRRLQDDGRGPQPAAASATAAPALRNVDSLSARRSRTSRSTSSQSSTARHGFPSPARAPPCAPQPCGVPCAASAQGVLGDGCAACVRCDQRWSLARAPLGAQIDRRSFATREARFARNARAARGGRLNRAVQRRGAPQLGGLPPGSWAVIGDVLQIAASGVGPRKTAYRSRVLVEGPWRTARPTCRFLSSAGALRQPLRPLRPQRALADRARPRAVLRFAPLRETARRSWAARYCGR